MDWKKKKKTIFFDIECHDSYLMKCLHNNIIVRGDQDSRANLMPIYGNLYQIKLKGITSENHLVTHLGFTSGRHYDVIKIAYIVSVQFKQYVHCSTWGSGLSCIFAPISVEMHQI